MRFLTVLGMAIMVLAHSFAQSPTFPSITLPVWQDGTALQFPFAGGLNSPQFSAADLNEDGKKDLVVFDRVGGSVLTFLNEGAGGMTNYRYAPEYACDFPALVFWALLRDYDGDGAADIFTAAGSSTEKQVKVYKGYFDNGRLRFAPFVFGYPDCPDCNPQFIYHTHLTDSDWSTLKINVLDVPAIDDIDGDGDLDVVSFEASVGLSMWYLKNLSVEKGFGKDSLIFTLADDCWGHFFEASQFACKNNLSGSPDTCATMFFKPEEGSLLHPGGSTTLTIDLDSDGDKETLIGHINADCLNQMKNGGTPHNAWMVAQDTLFPAYNTPVALFSAPAAFYLDLDNDVQHDLLVSPSINNFGEDRLNVWRYKNVSADGHPSFVLLQKDFLTADMIDVGTGAHPTFMDYNEDGLQDLVVGNFGALQDLNPKFASLSLYRNIGTSHAPQFELVENDWLDFKQFSPANLDFAPTGADIDTDGDVDLIVGAADGTLFFCKNRAENGTFGVFDPPEANWQMIDPGTSSSPLFYDLNGDGLLDLLVGERQGNINYYQNDGTLQVPHFPEQPTIEKLGKINTVGSLPGVGSSMPALFREAGQLKLVCGSYDGQLLAYEVPAVITDSFPLVSTLWGGTDYGARACPALADLDGDGRLTLAVGNQRGGVGLFDTQLLPCDSVSSTHTAVLPVIHYQIFPNPTQDAFRIVSETDVRVVVFDMLGQKTFEGDAAQKHWEIIAHHWAKGVYVINLFSEGSMIIEKIVVR